MSKYAKALHFKDGASTDDVILYTTLGEVVDPTVINSDGTTGGLTLYTTGADVSYPALRVQDGENLVYAQLVSPSSSRASNLRGSYNGTEYAVASVSTKAVGVALVSPGNNGAGTWARVDGDGNAIS